uniref:Uncharacterized protein n=1 Tax=Timema shepardi TaxID=629360 RepID=A0A7R9G0R8_TIMSH|nr:unnamed protein product [Timema shepardi]
MKALFEYQQTPETSLRNPMVQSLSHVNIMSTIHLGRSWVLSASRLFMGTGCLILKYYINSAINTSRGLSYGFRRRFRKSNHHPQILMFVSFFKTLNNVTINYSALLRYRRKYVSTFSGLIYDRDDILLIIYYKKGENFEVLRVNIFMGSIS